MIRTDKAPAPIGPYSQAVLAGNELFCSGQIAIDPSTGELNGSDAAAQAEQVLRNLGAVLRAAQMDYGNVVKTTIFLVDMNDFAAVNTVYAKYFDAAKPARSTVAVAALPKGALVEIDAIAKMQ
ncbi:MAG TPA: RidA family protein [Candidatus Baltobacteraceae bacterium]|nr:RidA family protein [Candidatus Baltobacteraceae bacterium]